MDDWGSISVRDIVTGSTGVYVSTGSSQDRPTISMRGGTASLLQIDGVQPFPGGRKPVIAGDSVAYERAEILRGANGLLTSSGDPTVTINKLPEEHPRQRCKWTSFWSTLASSR